MQAHMEDHRPTRLAAPHVSDSAAPQFRMARQAEERLAAYRLRYDVYVVEQGKAYPDADPASGMLCDELDACSEILIATVADAVVGTLRVSCFDAPPVRRRYASEFDIGATFPVPATNVCVCSRLAASAGHRDRIVRSGLFERVYRYGLSQGMRICFVTCAPRLLPLFLRYGFRECASAFSDPTVGTLHRTALLLGDLEYLARVRSPFHPIAREFDLGAETLEWAEIFPSHPESHS